MGWASWSLDRPVSGVDHVSRLLGTISAPAAGELTVRVIYRRLFFQVEMAAKLNEKPINLGEYVAIINQNEFQNDIAVQYYCINSQIMIFLHLDQGTSDPFGKKLGEIYIDVDTGEFLGEPRRSPKR